MTIPVEGMAAGWLAWTLSARNKEQAMTPMILKISKKLFLNLAAIPACVLNKLERREVFWRPARHPTLDALPHAGAPSTAPALHDQNVARSVSA
jgi:hypothetical protein